MLKNIQNKIKKSPENIKIKIAIIRSLFYESLTESLEKTCIETLIKSGVLSKNIDSYQVTGSWELPLVTSKVAASKKYDGIVVFGVIIKGETLHFELIARECARGLMDTSLKYQIPVTFEVLATFTLKQATIRALGKGNKGVEAAKSVLQTIHLLKS